VSCAADPQYSHFKSNDYDSGTSEKRIGCQVAIDGTPPGPRSAPTGKRTGFKRQVGCQAASLAFDLFLILTLIFLPHRKAERRFCAVGNPAWMPG